MSDADIYVDHRSESEIDEISLAVREVLGFGNQRCPNLLNALENELPRQLPQFALVPVADGSLGVNRVARASYDPHKIELVNSSYKKLGECDPQARFDVSHELGHFILHYGGEQSLPKYRTTGNVVLIKHRSFSGEEQADKFARGFLVPAHIACEFDCAEDIVEWCHVPTALAQEAYWLHGRRAQREIPPRLRAIFDELNRHE